MVEPLQLQAAAWALTTTLELALFVQLVRGKLARIYPLFFSYLVAVILQSIAVAVLYRQTNLDKLTVWKIAWATQGVAVLMRSLALAELNRRVLSRYVGIWALASRRGLELAMAAVIVTMLIFAHYYRVPVNHLQRALAVGLCLYSSFYVINYSLLERIVQQHAVLWNFLGIFAFIASLLVWIGAANRYAESEELALSPAISPELHGKLSSEVNTRLYLLNRQLIQLLRLKDRNQ